MIKVINDNRYFKFFQPKLFYINQDIDNDDPVRLLSTILEEMDFSNLLQVFPNKTTSCQYVCSNHLCLLTRQIFYKGY